MSSNIELITPDNTKVGYVNLDPIVKPNNRKGPGFLESIGKSFLRTSDVPAAINVASKLFAPNPLDDETPEGWSPVNDDYVQDIPVEYWDRVFMSRSPKEVEIRRKAILEEINEEEYMRKGSGIGNLIGNFGGGVFSLSSLIPIAGQLKYANATKGFINNAVKSLPGVSAQAILANTSLVAASETKDLGDWARDTFVETVAGSLIFGALGTRQARKIAVSKKALEAKWDGIEIKEVANPDGTFKTYKAYAPKDDSVGAARVKELNGFFEDGVDKLGENPIFKKIFSMSPITRGLTSDSEIIREWTNTLYRHNIVTGSIAEGAGQSFKAESIARHYFSKAMSIESAVGEVWAEYAGIRGPLKEARLKLKKKLGQVDDSIMDRGKFRKAMFDAMFMGGKHDDPFVAKAAGIVRKRYDEMFDEAVRLGFLDKNQRVAIDESYINLVYNKPQMEADEEGWMSNISAGLLKINNKLREIRAPLDSITENISLLKQQRKAAKEAGNSDLFKKFSVSVKKERLREKKIRQEIQEQIDTGKIGVEFLEGKPEFNPFETLALNKLRNPAVKERNKFVRPINESKNKVKQLEESLRVHKREINAGRKPGQKNKAPDEKQLSIESKLSEEKDLLKRLKKDLENHDIELDKKIGKWSNTSEYNPEFIEFRRGGAYRKFVDLKKKNWLRKPFDDAEAPIIAKGSYDKILQETPEQMMASMYGSIFSGGTNPLKSRTLLVGTEYKKPFLETDVINLLYMHSNYLGKAFGFEEAMRAKGFKSKEGIADFLEKLKNEFESSRSGATTKKEKDAIRKQYNKDKDFIETTYQIYWGNYNPGKLGGKTGENIDNVLRDLRNYDVSTMLGGVPFLQLGELFANMFRHSFMSVLEDGLLPYIRSSQFRKMSRANAADAGLACNVACNAHMQQLYGAGAHYQPKTGVSALAANLAKASGNVFGTNMIQDFNQTIAATVSQSQLIRTLRKFKAGQKLTKKETERLGLMELDPKEWADRILAQFDAHGQKVKDGPKSTGGYLANSKDWQDISASRAFLMAVNKEVDSIILSPNMLDTPFAFRNPFIASMTQFMSYGFSATNSFLIPLLQRPDAEKVIGILGMMSMGAPVGLLRKLSSGQEITEEDLSAKSILNEAVTNSGVLGHLWDVFQKVNGSFDIPYLEHLRADRFRNKNAWELMGGPLGGMVNSAHDLASMFISGQINEAGLKRGAALIPMSGAIYFKGLRNKAIEALGAPKTKADATKWIED